MPAPVAASMILFAITHTIIYGPNTLLRSVTPDFILGPGPEEPDIEPVRVIGDEEAKNEARKMYKAFVPTAVNPMGSKAHEADILPAPYD